jgi:succinate-semialdehyde dehydrogenase / glutarate-semialdehyde dehydrogenase
MKLNDAGLLRDLCCVGGEWLAEPGGARIEVRNPATGALVGTVPDMREQSARLAIERAHQALAGWRARTAKERAAVLRRWYELTVQHVQDLATILTAEQGKPLAESSGEILLGANYLEWFGEEAKRMYGEIIPGHQADKRLLVVRQPVGVVAAITPWNFPSSMISRKVGAALAAGCTVVCKPASQTPLSALAMAELALRAGVPAGVFNVITGKASAIGGEFTSHPLVRKLTFTGSTEVGKKLVQQCAGTLKKTSMELGGNAPFIVFDDADLDAAVAGAVQAKFRNSGQTCVCANRLLVQAGIYDAFATRFVQAVARLQVGNGLEGPTDQGPLIDTAALDKVEGLVADAVAQGASVALGGRRHALGATFYEPTVLREVSADMRVSREEIFGPVAPLIRFTHEAEAIAMANDTEFGLAAYFYTRDLARSWRVMEALDYGIVGINAGLVTTEVAPFGGMKESGHGREGSRHGLLDYTEIKYACVGGIA